MSIMRQYIDIFETKKRPSRLVLEQLPYKTADLAPVLSKDNVEYHYNVLTRGYVDRYNNKEGDPDFNKAGAFLHDIFFTQFKESESIEIKNFEIVSIYNNGKPQKNC